MSTPFYAPEPTQVPNRFTLEVTPQHLVGPPEFKHLMGCVNLAAAIHAMEHFTGQPLIWVNVQFLNRGPAQGEIEVRLTPRVQGRSLTHMGAEVWAGDVILSSLQATLGARSGPEAHQFHAMPEAPSPDRCEAKPIEFPADGTLMELIERRIVSETNETGEEVMWYRAPSEPKMTPGLLAIMADFLMGAHPLTRGSASLDNSFRMHSTDETDWVLVQKQITHWADGIVHGEVRLFSEKGTLLATGGQSALMPRTPID